MNAWPQVTFFSGGTEAPDETAQGEWLNLVTKAGFSYLMASVKYLRDGDYTVERMAKTRQRDACRSHCLRVRPGACRGRTPAAQPAAPKLGHTGSSEGGAAATAGK